MFMLYTRKEPFCQWCMLAKEILELKGVEYTECVVNVDISRNDYLSKFAEYYPGMAKRATVPLLVEDQTVIGGYEDIEKWIKERE